MSNVQKFVGKEEVVREEIACNLKKVKGDILKEFEKVCPTDRSFERLKKEMHDIFDQLQKDMLSKM